jgi:hypothetical protein
MAMLREWIWSHRAILCQARIRAVGRNRFVMRERSPRLADITAVTLLLLLVSVVCWQRAIYDSWLLRFDVATQFVSWYHFLGENVRRLRCLPGIPTISVARHSRGIPCPAGCICRP